MMQGKVSTTGRRVMGRLPQGSDLLEALTALCLQHNIALGEVRALGAVTRAAVGFYNQEKRAYETLSFDQEMEIVHCLGNISLLQGRPMVHAHITLADSQGRVFGGHLVEGNPIFACEFVIKEYKSETPFIRSQDEGTGLMLWR
jgi:hypothetical protein